MRTGTVFPKCSFMVFQRHIPKCARSGKNLTEPPTCASKAQHSPHLKGPLWVSNHHAVHLHRCTAAGAWVPSQGTCDLIYSSDSVRYILHCLHWRWLLSISGSNHLQKNRRESMTGSSLSFAQYSFFINSFSIPSPSYLHHLKIIRISPLFYCNN